MGISEVVSPVTRRGSKVASGQPLSPGARSDPGREGGPKFDNVQPSLSTARRLTKKPRFQALRPMVVGPED
jgi:hypothetical protein